MANHGKFKDKNPNLLPAGKPYPSSFNGVEESLNDPATSDLSTYENDFPWRKWEKTEMSKLGVNKHITEIKDTILGPYSYLDEIRPGEINKKYPLGRAQDPTPKLPDTWDCTKPFGMKIIRGFTAAETLEAQGKTTSMPKSQAALGKSLRRYSDGKINLNTSFGIKTPSDPRGGLMWQLFSQTYGQEEDEEMYNFLI